MPTQHDDGAVTPPTRAHAPRRGPLARRSLLLAAPAAALVVAGLVLRGSPPRPAVVDDGTGRTTAGGDELTPWGSLPPEAAGGTGVAVSAEGEVILLQRAGAPFASTRLMTADPLLVLDPATGRVRRSWGAGLFRSPHGVSVDRAGDVWTTDVMTNRITVFDRHGRARRVIGHDYGRGLDTCLAVRNELTNLPCSGDPYIFARPTDVAVTADSRAYVADGYRNSRVARFAADGSFEHAWGELGSAAGEFSIPHGIAVRADGVVAVADRRNARVQLFASDGRHLGAHASAQLGRPFDVAFAADGTLLALDGGDALDEPGGQHRAYVVALAPDGTVTRRWGLRDQHASPHQLAVGHGGELYVAALSGPPLWRWSPQP